MSVHIAAKKGDIAKTVLLPGDPLRAKYIADNFLTDVKLVSQTRNIFYFTGLYKGKEVSVGASGMGIPSIGIYSYELYTWENGIHNPNPIVINKSNNSYIQNGLNTNANNYAYYINSRSYCQNSPFFDTAKKHQTILLRFNGRTICL